MGRQARVSRGFAVRVSAAQSFVGLAGAGAQSGPGFNSSRLRLTHHRRQAPEPFRYGAGVNPTGLLQAADNRRGAAAIEGQFAVGLVFDQGDAEFIQQRRHGIALGLAVTKQALNMPLRQLLEMQLVNSVASQTDKRKRLLELTEAGGRFEQALRREQVKLLERVFIEAGEEAVNGWLAVNLALGKAVGGELLDL